jgi:uncharacterized protein (DUF2267 family)
VKNLQEITPEQRAILDAAIEDAERSEEILEDLPSDALAELWAGLEAIPNGRVRVARKTAKPGMPAGYMFSVPVDQVGSLDELLERIAAEYGGGDYKISLTNSAGQYLKNMQREIQIAEPVRKIEPVQHRESTPQNDNLSAVASMISAMQENTRAMVDSMRDAQQRQVESTNAILLQALTSGKESNQQAQTPVDMMAMFGMFKEVFGGKKEGDSFENFMQGLTLGRELASEGATESTLQTALKALGEPLLASVAAASAAQMPQQMAMQPNNQQQQRPPQQIAHESRQIAPVQNNAENAGNNQAQKEGEADMLRMLQQWQPYIQILATAAALDADKYIYAELLLDQIEPESLDTVIMNDENYEKLFIFVPNLQQFRQWFDELRKAVLDLREQDLIADQENGAESGGNVSGESEQANVPG